MARACILWFSPPYFIECITFFPLFCSCWFAGPEFLRRPCFLAKSSPASITCFRYAFKCRPLPIGFRGFIILLISLLYNVPNKNMQVFFLDLQDKQWWLYGNSKRVLHRNDRVHCHRHRLVCRFSKCPEKTSEFMPVSVVSKRQHKTTDNYEKYE